MPKKLTQEQKLAIWMIQHPRNLLDIFKAFEIARTAKLATKMSNLINKSGLSISKIQMEKKNIINYTMTEEQAAMNCIIMEKEIGQPIPTNF